MKELFDKLTAEFANPDYAHAYMENHLITRIASQVHAIRKQRGWSQQKLAEKAGLAQEQISKIESADFDSLTLKTLRKLSRAFDAHLHVSYVPFAIAILDTSNLTKNRLEVDTREISLDGCGKMTFRINFDGQWAQMATVQTTENAGPKTLVPDIRWAGTSVTTALEMANG